MYQTILVPLDGSERAEAIFSHVEHLAIQNQSRVVLLKVEEEPLMLGRDEVVDFEEYRRTIQQREKSSLEYLDKIRNRFGKKDILTEVRLVRGSVVKVILETAAETKSHLIAMATHGMGGLARVSYGSVAAGVLQAAEIPVLLIRS